MNHDLTPPQQPVAGAVDDTALRMARIVYILYLASLIVPVTAIVGVIMAYVYRDEAPEWLSTHFRFQVRTFWIGMLYMVVGALTALLVVGYLVLLFTLVWVIVRCIKGLQGLDRRRPVADPASWLFG